MKRKYLYLAAGAGGVLLLIWWVARSLGSTSDGGAPAVAGTVTSGSASTAINDNVLSPGFGLPIANTVN